MANFEIKISIDDERKFGAKLLAAVSNVLKDNFSIETKNRVVEEVDKAVKKVKDFFIPSDEQAVELGIGELGFISTKTEDAWRALLASEYTSFGITKINATKGKSKGKIGEIRITVDWDRFLNDIGITKIDAGDSEIGEIPWMKWFIEGITITGSRFKSGRFNFPPSRTGGGVMIPGRFWIFSPNPEGPIELEEEIKDRMQKLAIKIAKGK